MIENTYKKRAMFHVVRNANFHIKRQIKNFTQNDSPNLLLVYTASYSIRISSFFKFFTNFLDNSIDIFNIFLSFYHFSMLFNGKFCIFEFFQLLAALCWSTLFVCLSVGMSINFSSLGFMSFLACCFCPIALLTSNPQQCPEAISSAPLKNKWLSSETNGPKNATFAPHAPWHNFCMASSHGYYCNRVAQQHQVSFQRDYNYKKIY